MKKIMLNEEYYWCSKDEYIEVSEEIALFFEKCKKKEHSEKEKIRRHKAYYSLDVDNGIEKQVLHPPRTPEEIYIANEEEQERYMAIMQLPEVQMRRYYAYHYQELKMTEIAKIEGVSVKAISKTIDKAEKNIEKILQRGFKKC